MYASLKKSTPEADVCLILEGTYPFISGGVSSWTHDLISAHQDLTFHLVTFLAPDVDLTPRFEVPGNVLGLTKIYVQDLPSGRLRGSRLQSLLTGLEKPIANLFFEGGLDEIRRALEVMEPHRSRLGCRPLLNSKTAWQALVRMYERELPHASFLDFFWSWRALLTGLYSTLLAELPAARVYHAVSTGYAGLYAARAHLETGRPALVTEHGIYTNERRIEIAMANWLHQAAHEGLDVEKAKLELKDLWVNMFTSYSRACYEASAQIITLFEGNQTLQLEDGADQEKLRVIPNGVDFDRYSKIERDPAPRPTTITLIGRVVSIKDVKTFIRACALLRSSVPDLQALVLGPTDEEEDYFQSCQDMVKFMGLEETVLFLGRVRLDEYLGKVDAIVLTSVSEAQPLVILEGGAAGVPSVATDVGACREMILGRSSEDPQLGPGGGVTPLSNPEATAQELSRLLTDPDWHARCSQAIRERVRRYYNKIDLDRTYRQLYEEQRTAPSGCSRLEGVA